MADVCLVALIGLLVSVRAIAIPDNPRTSPMREPARPARREDSYRDTARSARREESYVSNGPGRFEPAGHSYRMTPEDFDDSLIRAPRQLDPPSIKVYRSDDPPSTRLTRRAGAVTDSSSVLKDPQLIRVGRPSEATQRKPRMFIEEEEEDFLQAQGL